MKLANNFQNVMFYMFGILIIINVVSIVVGWFIENEIINWLISTFIIFLIGFLYWILNPYKDFQCSNCHYAE